MIVYFLEVTDYSSSKVCLSATHLSDWCIALDHSSCVSVQRDSHPLQSLCRKTPPQVHRLSLMILYIVSLSSNQHLLVQPKVVNVATVLQVPKAQQRLEALNILFAHVKFEYVYQQSHLWPLDGSGEVLSPQCNWDSVPSISIVGSQGFFNGSKQEITRAWPSVQWQMKHASYDC